MGQHVIEEADAGGHVGPAGAVEIEGKADAGFGGFALNASGACHARPWKNQSLWATGFEPREPGCGNVVAMPR